MMMLNTCYVIVVEMNMEDIIKQIEDDIPYWRFCQILYDIGKSYTPNI